MSYTIICRKPSKATVAHEAKTAAAALEECRRQAAAGMTLTVSNGQGEHLTWYDLEEAADDEALRPA